MKVAVIGLGYVGLPLACLCVEKGMDVFGGDIDKAKISLIEKGISPIEDPYLEESVKKSKGKLKVTDRPEAAVKNSEVVIVCVPTPVDEKHLPDLKPLISSCELVAKGLQPDTLVVIESTIFPGTVEEIVMPILKKANVNFYLAHCPERIDPGNKKFTIRNIPRVVGGINRESTKRTAEFYRKIIDANVLELSSVKAAEATKIMENTFRDINIAFVNEMAKSFDKAGIDITEVIKGASTKPFSFMPHYPGVGVGGHCFDKNEWIFVKHDDSVHPVKIGELYELIKYYNETEIGELHLASPGSLEVLSFDLGSKKSCYKRISMMSKRAYSRMLKIKTSCGYSVKVTDKHPVVVYDGNFKVKNADELGKDDRMVVSLNLPEIERELKIDLIGHIDDILGKKIRVKLVNDSFRNYKKELIPSVSKYKYYHDFFRYDMLPLSYFLKAEKELGIPREKVYLCTGRGPELRKIDAILKVDKDFSRLLGYYLSEGCLTEDKTLRIRFTFNQNEKEYIDDVKSILDKKGFRYSEYTDTKNHSHHIKVSSELLGIAIRDILKCGTNCYNMLIPPKLFSMPKDIRIEAIKGILRGDGGVTTANKKRAYKKGSRHYVHNNNSATTTYFTSSSGLKQQVTLILQDSKMMPKNEARQGLIRLHGAKNALLLKDLFLGSKHRKLDDYLQNLKKMITYPDVQIFDTFATVKISSIEESAGDYVYSLEVKDTGTIITTNGLVMHNCIAVDPYYLISKAKEMGFNHEFLILARKINESMPSYTVSLLESELKKMNKSLSGAKVGVLGLAYKADVDDVRESPSWEVIHILKEKNAEVFVFDPHVKNGSNVSSIGELLKKSDYIILATAHKEFREMDLDKLKENNIRIIIDGRNCLDKERIKEMGIPYHGIGRA